ncbi:hypothetical protein S7335_2976 [Synechococcus sp. PCC 7335]|nr:hypothetical protein S7335_2976 [Synechococcus sp. PCC 7335]
MMLLASAVVRQRRSLLAQLPPGSSYSKRATTRGLTAAGRLICCSVMVLTSE